MRNYSKIVSTLRKESTTQKHTVTNNRVDYQQLLEASFGDTRLAFPMGKVKKARDYVLELVDKRKAVYGVTTSFGGNIHHIIPPENAKVLQKNLILSHAINIGENYPYEITKTAFILRSATLAQGFSGISPNTLALVSKMIKIGLVPVVKIHGSMGASGDIGPLATLALPLIGEGSVWLPDKKTIVPTKQAFKKYNLHPISLGYKEGLSLLNGTTMMTTVGSYNLWYLKRLIENSLVVSAMSIEALRASKQPFDSKLHQLKPHKYQISTAAVMERVLRNSKLARSHAELSKRIEVDLQKHSDPFYSDTDLQGGSYSLRAIPEAYQSILSIFKLFEETINTEIAAIDDNPLVLPEEKTELHGANFHGLPIALTSDSLNLALVSIANISLARIDRMLKKTHSKLPWFLATGEEGLFLGMHGIQFTAAGIGAELRNLADPVSVDQIPTNNDNQDFVSLGLQSTNKGLEMVFLLSYVLAVEYMVAAQGIWLTLGQEKNHAAEKLLSPVTRSAYEQVLKIYTPKKSEDQNMIAPLENISEQLLLNSLLPKNLSNILWK